MERKDKRQFLKQFQPGGTLAEGEETRVHRVRAIKEVHEWLATLTAVERGRLLTQAYVDTTTTNVTTVEETDVTTVKSSSRRNNQGVNVATDVTTVNRVAARPSMRAGGVKRTNSERLALHVPALGVMQQRVPRGLGWKPDRYAQTEALLSQGDVLLADGVNYRTAQGNLMGYRTVEALVRLGVLVPA